MLTDLKAAAGEAGLQLHPEKTKVITNGKHAVQSHITIPDGKIDILPEDQAVKYLGKTLAMIGMQDAEKDHRIQAA